MDISAFIVNVPPAVTVMPLRIHHFVPAHLSPLASHHHSRRDARTSVTASLAPTRRIASKSSTWLRESGIPMKQHLVKMSLHVLWSKATAAFSSESEPMGIRP
ncbi:hypothetical protein TNIN_170191 [Trichonephila inaurata madagascariensis]|uniref:Uncharacterized protein n=1 Tax=Trichonephila inaurata madagascariensis TaxID=2747483 RepID=A0A8X6YP27_9ARAC|nr:hypothetical protein TNIN_170191 [Trichonephila inaurata madagascariensis]